MSAMVVTTATLVSSRVLPRTGPRPLVPTGMAIAGVSMLILTRIGVDTTYATHVLPAFLLLGLGFGMVMAPAIATATRDVRPQDAGVCSALVNTMQQVGASVGIALLSTLSATATTNFVTSHGGPTDTPLRFGGPRESSSSVRSPPAFSCDRGRRSLTRRSRRGWPDESAEPVASLGRVDAPQREPSASEVTYTDRGRQLTDILLSHLSDEEEELVEPLARLGSYRGQV
jgi:hypothetical protein